MKKLMSMELRRPSELHDRCKYFDTDDNSFFCIQISDSLFRHFVYDVLMNIMKSDFVDPESSERYLKLVYAHHGLKCCYVTITTQDDPETNTATVNFNPKEFTGPLASEILLEELRMGAVKHGPFEVFPPAILLDEDEKLLKNSLEHISACLFETPTVLINGDDLPDDIREEILRKHNGIINITGCFKPEKWNLKDVYESIPEN